MSVTEAWVLPLPLPSYEPGEVLARVRALLPAGTAVDAVGHDRRTVRVTFTVSEVEAVAAHLARREGQLAWDWRADLDPPLADGQTYDLFVALVHDGYPLLRIDPRDGENRQGWPLLFSLASSLAEDLGAVPAEEMPPESDHLSLVRALGRLKPN